MTFCRCPRCQAERREARERVLACILMPALGLACFILWRVTR